MEDLPLLLRAAWPPRQRTTRSRPPACLIYLMKLSAKIVFLSASLRNLHIADERHRLWIGACAQHRRVVRSPLLGPTRSYIGRKRASGRSGTDIFRCRARLPENTSLH